MAVSAEDTITLLQTCWCQALEDTVLGSPAQCCLTTDSEVVVVECCAGKAWVKVTGAYPSKAFPSPYSAPDNCRVDTWGLQVELGIARCAPQPCEVTDNVCCSEELLAFQGQMSDFTALRRVFSCCLSGIVDQWGQPMIRQDEIVVGPYNVETSGGCSVATMTATIRIAEFCECA